MDGPGPLDPGQHDEAPTRGERADGSPAEEEGRTLCSGLNLSLVFFFFF